MDRVNGRGPVVNIEPHPEDSVAKEPLQGEYGFGDNFLIWMTSVADDLPQWGTFPYARDRALRAFWPTEPLLASAIYTMVARYSAFGYKLEGPHRMVEVYNQVMQSAQGGQGWEAYIVPTVIDYLTQDNGAFTEIVRIDNNDPTSPVITFNHLDSNRCIRTGRSKEPVIYYDRWGVAHLMKWWQVVPLCEMPSPIESMRGVGYCAVTRVLRAAQTMRDISIHNREKLSGRFNKAIHVLSGVSRQSINDAIAQQTAQVDDQGLTRYKQPLVVVGLDPQNKISHEVVELASLPDGFDIEKAFQIYITNLAMGLGTDYQEFAPISKSTGGSSGGGADVMHMKGRGKGPKLFIRLMESLFNWHGILPKNVRMIYADMDSGEDLDRTKSNLLSAELRAMQIKSGEISPEVARLIAVDEGDLDRKYLPLLKDYVPLEQQKLEDAKDGMLKSNQAPQVDRNSA